MRNSQTTDSGQTVVALVNREATLKRYYPKKHQVELRQRNPEYPIIRIKKIDDFQINGVVLCSFREC